MPQALPSLIKAFRIQEKAHNVGFDWDEASDSWQKVKEEILEFETEIEHMDKERAENELGIFCSVWLIWHVFIKLIQIMP